MRSSALWVSGSLTLFTLWVPYQRPASMYGNGDAYVLEEVRYGFVEHGPDLEDWKARFGTAVGFNPVTLPMCMWMFSRFLHLKRSPGTRFSSSSSITGMGCMIFTVSGSRVPAPWALRRLPWSHAGPRSGRRSFRQQRGLAFRGGTAAAGAVFQPLIGGSMAVFPIVYLFGSWR